MHRPRDAVVFARGYAYAVESRENKGVSMKLCVVANCQGERIAELIRLQCPTVDMLPIKSVHTLTADDHDAARAAFDQADIILSQPISADFSPTWVGTPSLRSDYGDKVRVVTNIYFTGYDPSWCYITSPQGERLLGPMDGGHFKPIVDAFVAGKSAATARQDWDALDASYVTRVQDSLAELHRRDEQVDIPLAPLVERHFTQQRLLHTMHHPTIGMFQIMTAEILKHLGIVASERLSDDAADQMLALNDFIVACNPAIHQALDMRFERDTLHRGWAIVDDKPAGLRYYSSADLVEAFYARYAIYERAIGLEAMQTTSFY